MTSFIRVAAVAACLSLAACSSDGATPSTMTDAEVCDALEQWGVAFEEAGTSMSVLGELLSAAENPEDLPSAETIQRLGTEILATSDDADEALAKASVGIDDAKVVSQLQSLNDITLEMARWLGQAAVDSDGAMSFSLAIMAEMDRMETFYAEFETLDMDAAGEYITTQCRSMSGFGGSAGQAEDSQAKADVSTLGKEIATYYVDADPGIDPVITIVGDDYYLLGTNIAPVSPNVRITNQYYVDAVDWCVEVSNDRGDLQTFTYSAQRGLEAGYCTQEAVAP